MVIATYVISALAVVISAHSVLYSATTGYHLRRLRTDEWDLPRPWYVRYTDWLDKHLPEPKR